MSAITKHDLIDGLAWAGVALGARATLPYSITNGDGFAIAARVTSGKYDLNPNHLLLEPISEWWLSLITGAPSLGALHDRLSWLSILGVMFALSAFRVFLGLASESRTDANLKTLILAFTWAVLGQAFETEPHAVQLPFLLIGVLAPILSEGKDRYWRPVILGGACWSVAILLFLSNAVLLLGIACAAIALAARKRDEVRMSTALKWIGVTGVGGGVALVVLGLSWLTHAGGSSFIGWLTGYGGLSTDQASQAYGLDGSVRDLIAAISRAVLGVGESVLVLTPARRALHGQVEPVSLALCVGALLALCAIVVHIWRNASRSDLAALASIQAARIGVLAGVVSFAIYWNNSDSQFYFQLAVVTALTLLGTPMGRARIAYVSVLGILLLWNGSYWLTNVALYPREDRVAVLQAATQASGIVYLPGGDELEQLSYFLDRPPGSVRSIREILWNAPPGKGPESLVSSLLSAVERSGEVSVIGLKEADPRVTPWSTLARLGYRPDSLFSLIASESGFAMSVDAEVIGSTHLRLYTTNQ